MPEKIITEPQKRVPGREQREGVVTPPINRPVPKPPPTPKKK